MLRAYVSPYKDEEDDDQSLDEVGPFAVLGAMVEQRKRSNLLPSHAPEPSAEANETTADESGTHPRQRLPSGLDPLDVQDVFQKIR